MRMACVIGCCGAGDEFGADGESGDGCWADCDGGADCGPGIGEGSGLDDCELDFDVDMDF